jgi:hypothetical protein
VPIRVLDDPTSACTIPPGDVLVDACRPMVVGTFDAGPGVTGAVAVDACAAWLRDGRIWHPGIRSTLRVIGLSHRQGNRIVLRCWCPDRHHAQAVARVVLEDDKPEAPRRKRGGQPGNQNARANE